jgi:5-methylcytosine-specific restriction protein A
VDRSRGYVMAKNIPRDITRQDVLEAIAAYSDGTVAHGFHESEKYDLLHDGKRYPPKAILGLAARRTAGHVLEPSDFSGGEGSPCFNVLRGCGFTVALKPGVESSEGSDWSDAEIDAALSAYLSMLRDEIAGKQFSKAEVNRRLRSASLINRSKGSVEYRMQNISSVLLGLNRRWITGYKPAANVGASVARKIVASLERLEALKNEDSLPESDPVVLDHKVRRNRLVPLSHQPEGAKAPRKVTRSMEQYERLPQVKAWVLQNAGGRCQLCGGDAPFLDDFGFPFLEVHHVVPLADGGEDAVSNAVALCPNCHRRCHHGADRDQISIKLCAIASGVNA